jgi:hypothetical protein
MVLRLMQTADILIFLNIKLIMILCIVKSINNAGDNVKDFSVHTTWIYLI